MRHYFVILSSFFISSASIQSSTVESDIPTFLRLFYVYSDQKVSDIPLSLITTASSTKNLLTDLPDYPLTSPTAHSTDLTSPVTPNLVSRHFLIRHVDHTLNDQHEYKANCLNSYQTNSLLIELVDALADFIIVTVLHYFILFPLYLQ